MAAESPNTRLVGGVLVLLGHVLSLTTAYHIVVPHMHACPGGDTTRFMTSFIIGPTTLLIATLLVWAGAKLGVQPRWPLLFQIVIGILVGFYLVPDLRDVTLEHQHLCGSHLAETMSVPAWHAGFAPALLGTWALFAAVTLLSTLTRRN